MMIIYGYIFCVDSCLSYVINMMAYGLVKKTTV